MMPTYPATLRNGRIEWGPNGPPPLTPDESIPIHVTLLAVPKLQTSNGAAMVAALEAIAKAGGPTSFPEDVVAWQREERKDRPLPGRDE